MVDTSGATMVIGARADNPTRPTQTIPILISVLFSRQSQSSAMRILRVRSNSSSSSSSSSSSPSSSVSNSNLIEPWFQPYIAESSTCTHEQVEEVIQKIGQRKDTFQAVIVEYSIQHQQQQQTDTTNTNPTQPAPYVGVGAPSPSFLSLLARLSGAMPHAFLVVLSDDRSATECSTLRWSCFQVRVHMVTSILSPDALTTALTLLESQHRSRMVHSRKSLASTTPTFICPCCELNELTPDMLHSHTTLFHSNTKLKTMVKCPICDTIEKQYFVHLHNFHGPPSRGEAPNESDKPNLFYPYALCVIRRPSDGKFLMVQEFSNSGFWLPGGHVENGETLSDGAKRETFEEAGVNVRLIGILSIEYESYKTEQPTLHRGHTRMRVIFLGEPASVADGEQCKTLPDYESVGAVWASVDELEHMALRGSEPLEWFPYVTNGGTVHALELLSERGRTLTRR